jgi:hypothetical protein
MIFLCESVSLFRECLYSSALMVLLWSQNFLMMVLLLHRWEDKGTAFFLTGKCTLSTTFYLFIILCRITVHNVHQMSTLFNISLLLYCATVIVTWIFLFLKKLAAKYFITLLLPVVICHASVSLCVFLKSWTRPQGAIKQGTVDVN